MGEVSISANVDLEASSGLFSDHTPNSYNHDIDTVDCKKGAKKSDSFLSSILCAEIFRCPMEPKTSFLSSLFERTSWLAGLLILQSCSSYILEANISLMESHPAIIYFLTMLVGAGGNAGNQAAVRIIRGIAIGSVNEQNRHKVLLRELFMAFAVCVLVCGIGLLRCLFFSHNTLQETAAIIASLAIIVFVSIVLGAILPFLLHSLGVDCAHASTTIQVIMDILGVLFTCSISSLMLRTLFTAPIQ
jgi:Mg/Co/Ni transporter MgtE